MEEYNYYVYWEEDGEPASREFSCLAEAEMFSCMIRGQEGVEAVEVSKERVLTREEMEKLCPGSDLSDYGEWESF